MVKLNMMSFCEDIILTNSAFGWWSDWMNKNENKNENKKVVFPNK
jgi:hypothetical protein